MKAFQSLLILLIAAAGFVLVGCEQDTPLSSVERGEVTSNDAGPNFLKLENRARQLNKTIDVRKWISPLLGGQLVIEHGSADGSADNLLYGNSKTYPYDIYQIDPDAPGQGVVAGQLAFSSGALAMHPFSGLIYYLARESQDGIYPIGVWNSATNENVLLPDGSSFTPATKLAFGLDGTLYGVKDNNGQSSDLYTINTTSGAWTFLRTYDENLGDKGDMSMNEDGQLYNINQQTKRLQMVDLNSNAVTEIAHIDVTGIAGMSFAHDGTLYAYRENKEKIYTLDIESGEEAFLGSTNLNNVDDLCPVIALTEFTYAKVVLTVPPGAVDVDTEFSLSINTHEIVGGCFVTFEPHGTIFNTPVILNLEAHGVDFDGVDETSVDIYYDNEESGQWELMQRQSVEVNLTSESVKVTNALLNHFSRYGIAGN